MDKTGKASWRNQAIWLIDHATWVLSVIDSITMSAPTPA